MWVAHITPETEQSVHLHHSGSPCKVKFKQILSAWKVMCTVFWVRRGILLVNFLIRGETVNAEPYCKTLQKMRQANQNKQCKMFSTSVLLHDNIQPHMTDGQHISCRSSTVRCLIIHHIAWTSHPVISIFSYTSRNSCPVSFSIFRMTERCR